MLKEIYRDTENRMNKTLESLSRELAGIRTGKASTNMLDVVRVDYYGTPTPLKQVASITAPDPRLIVIQPWEKNLIPEIVKAVQKAELGINPVSESGVVRLPIPPLTEERRREIVKLVKKFGEDAKVSIRNVRRDSIEALKKAEKDGKITEDELHQGQKHLQDATDNHIDKIDKMVEAKDAEVMEV
jgi:ribosome recycling factor